MNKRLLIIPALLVGLAVSSISASAAPVCLSKSISQIQKSYSETQARDLFKANCITVTYGGTVLGTYQPSAVVTPPVVTPPVVTPPVVTPPVVTPPVTTATAPSDLLNLTNWYEGIPVNTSHDGDPDIIRQPELTGYTNPNFFYVNAAKTGVVFKTPAGGYATSNSSYPRSELREMNGTALASWNSKTGTNTLTETESIDAIGTVKPDMVAAQIHDSSDDVIEIELSGTRLYVKYDDDNKTTTIDANYKLGTPYDLKLVATSAGIQVWYNGVLSTTVKQTGSGWYFKTGAYLQTNVSKGDAASTVGQVTIYNLNVTHN